MRRQQSLCVTLLLPATALAAGVMVFICPCAKKACCVCQELCRVILLLYKKVIQDWKPK